MAGQNHGNGFMILSVMILSSLRHDRRPMSASLHLSKSAFNPTGECH